MKYRSIFFSLLAVCVFASASVAQDPRLEGLDLYREGKFAEAVTKLEAHVAAVPNDRMAWIYLAGAHLHLKNIDKATDAFETANEVRLPTGPPQYDRSVKILEKPRVSYTAQARRNRSSGTVRIAVELRADGQIGFVFPLPTRIDDSLIKESMNAARGIRFEPAIKNGKPVTVINFVEYSFMTY